MTVKKERPKPELVIKLEQLHREKEGGAAKARAMLANLRADARTGRTTTLLPFVLHCHVSESEEEDAMLFAGLFASHPLPSSSVTLPSALRQHGMVDGKIPPGLDLRMRSLFSSEREDLDSHMRSLLALAVSKGATSLNWTHLYHSIRRWDADLPASKRHDGAKRWWARYFWAPPPPPPATDESTPTPDHQQAPAS